MNKQEIKKRVRLLKVEAETLNTMLENFETQLAEAEKPKLRHGDFGLWKFLPSNDPKKAIYINKHSVKDTVYTDKAEWCTRASDDDGREMIILGNVFDLMKDWDKPFENCEIINSEKDEFYFHLEAVNRKHISFKLNDIGNWFHASISEAEEIWHALGHAIAELKRKQGD